MNCSCSCCCLARLGYSPPAELYLSREVRGGVAYNPFDSRGWAACQFKLQMKCWLSKHFYDGIITSFIFIRKVVSRLHRKEILLWTESGKTKLTKDDRATNLSRCGFRWGGKTGKLPRHLCRSLIKSNFHLSNWKLLITGFSTFSGIFWIRQLCPIKSQSFAEFRWVSLSFAIFYKGNRTHNQDTYSGWPHTAKYETEAMAKGQRHFARDRRSKIGIKNWI